MQCVCIRMIPVPGLYGVGLYSGPAASGPVPSRVATHSGGGHAMPSVWERNKADITLLEPIQLLHITIYKKTHHVISYSKYA